MATFTRAAFKRGDRWLQEVGDFLLREIVFVALSGLASVQMARTTENLSGKATFLRWGNLAPAHILSYRPWLDPEFASEKRRWRSCFAKGENTGIIG